VSINRAGGFVGAVALSATGLLSGATAAFNPASTTGNTSTVTLCTTATTPLGAFTVTITGVGGGLTRTLPIALTVSTAPVPDVAPSANPAALTVNRGASGTSTISLLRTGGFASSLAFSAAGLPAGVTATFNPASTTGNSTVLTLAASSTATLGAAAVTVTCTGGGLTRSATIALTVAGGGTGGVTVTPVVTASSAWFNEEQIRLSNTATLTALSVTVVVQRTTGVGFSGQYNTIGGQIKQSNASTAATVTYQFTLAIGQTLGAGTNRTFAAQASGSGTVHPTTGDTYTVTYTTGGVSYTQSGHF
jgi:hypothetical protein